MDRFAEDKVDAMRKKKDEELEHYKKEIERAKRFESQKGVGVTGAIEGQPKAVKKKIRVNRVNQG